jgi:hypothetical protein
MEMMAELLLEAGVGAALGGGSYWCPDDGVAVWVSKHRDWIDHRDEWWDEMDALLYERDEVRAAQRSAGRGASRRLADERALLRRAMRRLVSEAVRYPRGEAELRVMVVLSRTDDPSVGLTVFRRDESPPVTAPWKEPGFRVVLPFGAEFPGLAPALSGVEIDPPVRDNAILAARMNGWTDTAITALLESDALGALFERGEFEEVRLVFTPEPPLRVDHLPHLTEQEVPVLQVNLAASRAEQAAAALDALAGAAAGDEP